jgi:hypothetical protein
MAELFERILLRHDAADGGKTAGNGEKTTAGTAGKGSDMTGPLSTTGPASRVQVGRQ